MTSEGLVIRHAGVADLACIVELLLLGRIQGGPPSTENPEDLGPYRTALREIAASGGAVLVAELSGEVVGTCQLIVFRHLQARGTAGAPRSSRSMCTRTTGDQGWAASSHATRSNGPVGWAVTGSS
jgi:hypothetical protein